MPSAPVTGLVSSLSAIAPAADIEIVLLWLVRAWIVTSPPTPLSAWVIGSVACSKPVSSLAPAPMCTVDSLMMTATPTPITAGTAPTWPGSSAISISLVRSDLIVIDLDAITVPCTSMVDLFCSTPTAMPAIFATKGLSLTVTDVVDVMLTSPLDTSRACVPTLIDELYSMPAQAAMALAPSRNFIRASKAELTPPASPPSTPPWFAPFLISGSRS